MTRPTVSYHARSGAALLIVLALVTIISILLLAYMGTVRFERTATQNYSDGLTADQIAKGGLDREIADLKQEIVAGSVAYTATNTSAPVYYKPISPTAMTPARFNDTGYSYTNVVRVSSSNSTIYSGAYPLSAYPGQYPANLAAASSTTNPCPDGRYLSAARWQAPQLLLPTETGTATMPIPDWILMTRSGPTNASGLVFGSTGNTLNNQASSNPNYVVGRYAYIIYNEGGLLDATVAGSPTSGSGAPSADDNGNRGSLAMAALTNATLTPAQMNALAGWRNISTDTSENTYTNYVYGIQSTNGFLQVQPGDNTFLSRQDLIAYANYAGMASALPYLGTFNRAVNAPAYTPFTASAINPDLLTLRFSNSGTINLNSTGNKLTSRTVKAGDFLLTRRFPLSRLSWVGYNGPANGANAYDVWRAFGLVWDNSSNCWDYVNASGTSPSLSIPLSIKTLAAVAQEKPPRDPDFFELLQAGILNGSLGQTGGAQASFASTITYLYGGSGDTSGYDSVQAYHVMQIGVNIIDQARADNCPTAILLGADSRDTFVSTSATNTSARIFYGVKNLPYINRIVDTYARWVTPPPPLSNMDISTTNTPFPGRVYNQPYVGCWEQVELWNPHQISATPTTNYPSAVRVTAEGLIHGIIYSRASLTSSNYPSATFSPGNAITKGTGETTWATNTAYIELNANGIQTAFSEPKLISTNDVTGNYTTNCFQTGALTTGGGSNGAGGTPFVGLYVGSSYAPDWAYSANNPGTQYPGTNVIASTTVDPACLSYNTGRIDPYTGTSAAFHPGVSYEMEYRDPSGIWRKYGVVKNQALEADTTFAVSSAGVSTWSVTNSNAGARFDEAIDPRTNRFSMRKGREIDTAVNPIRQSPSKNDTLRPNTGVGYAVSECIPYGATPGTTGTLVWSGATNAPPIPKTIFTSVYYVGGVMENTTNSLVYYTDVDGTLRRGDSAYDSAGSTDGRPGIANSDLSFSSGVNLARPVFLNRPFRSVGELGYVDRDLPWKTLDFFTKDSADAALLDLFSVSDADVVAGTIDLNTRNAQALTEVLGGSAINPLHTSDSVASSLSTAQASTLAGTFITATTTRPLQSRSEMVTSARDPTTGETILTTDGFTAQSSKIQREAAVRALAEVGNARTWNLLIDIIAQSGRYAPNLSAGSSYDSFIPDGEKRYWLHIAIDRYTGKVIDRYLEPVQE